MTTTSSATPTKPASVASDASAGAPSTPTLTDRLDAIVGELKSFSGRGESLRRKTREAIAAALCDETLGTWSDGRIGQAIGCSDKTVAAVRHELEAAGVIAPVGVRVAINDRRQPAFRYERTSGKADSSVASLTNVTATAVPLSSTDTDEIIARIVSGIRATVHVDGIVACEAYANALEAARDLSGALAWLRVVATPTAGAA